MLGYIKRNIDLFIVCNKYLLPEIPHKKIVFLISFLKNNQRRINIQLFFIKLILSLYEDDERNLWKPVLDQGICSKPEAGDILYPFDVWCQLEARYVREV